MIYKVHDGCFLDTKEVCAAWSEKYSDPKLDNDCYLVRALFKNNSTILTLANCPSKEEADRLLKKLHSYV